MSTIYDVVTPKFTSSRWEVEKQDLPPYLGEAFFPERKQLGIEISYLKGKKPNVRPLDLSAFDVKALPLERGAFEKVTTELPFFKNFISVNEKMRQELLKVIATGNEKYINAVLDEVYNDNRTLLEDARVTREVMRMQLMTSGTINFSSNGIGISYDFGIPSANKKTLESKKWSDASTSDPIGDITSWQDAVETATGVRPKNLLMNRTTFNMMKKSNSIKDTILYSNLTTGNVLINDAMVKAFVMEQTGCTIYVYDKGYFPQGSTTFTKFVADNVVVLFPDGALGEFVFGTTPEEADLMGGATNAEVEIVDLGVAITTSKETDPVNVKTKVSEICVPTLEVPDQMIIATVA